MKRIDYLPAQLMTKTNLHTWLLESQNKLTGVSDFPGIETYAIASFVLSQTKEWLITHPDYSLSSELLEKMNSFNNRLQQGEPLPYLLGSQSFFGLEFEVTPDVLIPRPETELLVEEAIQWLQLHPHRRSMIDVGTGSGIIPITLADHFVRPLCARCGHFSTNALEVANRNVVKYNLQERIRTYPNDLLSGITGTFDLITANLPYIPSSRLNSCAVSRFEPLDALDGGTGWIQIDTQIIRARRPKTSIPGGLLLLEIDDSQADIGCRRSHKIPAFC